MGAQRGFTLMELLIALTLLGLMMVMVFGGLRLGARSWDAAEMRAEQSGDQRLVWSFLQRSLTEMKGVYLQGGEVDNRVAFSGSGDALEFVGSMPKRLGPGGAYVIRIEAPRSGKRRDLVLRRWLYHPEVLEGLESAPPWAPLYDQVGGPEPLADEEDRWDRSLYGEHLLFEDIEELKIDYYGIVEGRVDPEWHEEWLEPSTMPTLVRLRVYSEQGEWPPLVAALPALSDELGGQSPGGTRFR